MRIAAAALWPFDGTHILESGAAVAFSHDSRLSLSFAFILCGAAGKGEGEHPSDIYSWAESRSMDCTLY